MQKLQYDNKIYWVRWYNLLPNSVWQYKLKSLSDEVLVEETLVSKYESTKKRTFKKEKKMRDTGERFECGCGKVFQGPGAKIKFLAHQTTDCKF